MAMQTRCRQALKNNITFLVQNLNLQSNPQILTHLLQEGVISEVSVLLLNSGPKLQDNMHVLSGQQPATFHETLFLHLMLKLSVCC